MRANKDVNIEQLQAELVAAGVPVKGIGSTNRGDGTFDVYTYTDSGGIINLPKEALPVLEAHEAAPPPPTPPEQIDKIIDDAVSAIDGGADPAEKTIEALQSIKAVLGTGAGA